MFDKLSPRSYHLYKQTLDFSGRGELVVKKSPIHALSIKQPWAALVVAGLKSIEIRRWPTARRGRILIHAARVPDDRLDAWKYVQTPLLRELAQLRGGIIGAVELTGCLSYQDLAGFAGDQPN